MEKLDRERKGGGGREEQAEVAEEGPLPPPPFSRMKFELLRWSVIRSVGRSRSLVPLFKAALFGNDAKDAYGDECAAAAAAAAVPDIFQGKVIQRTITIISCF